MNTRPTLSRALLAPVLVLAASALGADCEGNIVNDPTFRDWCGDSLCSWQTDSGQIRRVPTWDANDLGVSFLDNGAVGTEISQATEESQATCILFTSVGNIDPAADMSLTVDFDNDGVIDFTAPLGAATWTKVQTEITAPATYRGITFRVKKSGTGTAILAEMTITSTTGCTAAPVTLTALRLGDVCSSTSQCGPDLVCPAEGLRVCSECSADSPCGDGAIACRQRDAFFPLQCGPGEGLGQYNAPCIANDDCASGVCQGATAVGLNTPDASPCDINATSAADAATCFWDSALGGLCR
jgi:hypothetical protein